MASARSLNAGLVTSEVPNLRTNYLGRGRGRGSRGKNSNISSAPSGLAKEGDKQQNDNISPAEVEAAAEGVNYSALKAEDKVLYLLKKMCSQHPNQRIIELSAEDESAILEKVLESISTGQELCSLVSGLYDWTLQNPATTSCVASLSAQLSKFEKGGVSFRSALMNPLEADFQSRDEWNKDQPIRWLSYVCLMCDLYAMMKTAADGYLNALVEPVYSCLDQLLTDNKASDIQIGYATLKLKQLGKILQTKEPSKMELLMEGLRSRFLGSGTSATGRLLLLETIELYASGWQFDEETTTAYVELRQMSQEKA
ncbi:CBP80/20-dependent translation initiation factor-like [Acanthaster planci]|uniref:CBP80/20-dependent translation initiation factor-like n=1 Tax=Acanthaster planci TaxID=133434 RepID=A0A8B7XVB0_ACAPL|nr:CBP80/20-dependent translation initiation factor-like [Acanthaster planci]